MKNTVKTITAVLLVIITMLGVFTGCSSEEETLEKNLLGTWTGTEEGEQICYTFEPLHKVDDGRTLGNVEREDGGSNYTLTDYFYTLEGETITVHVRRLSLTSGAREYVHNTMHMETRNGHQVLVDAEGNVFTRQAN